MMIIYESFVKLFKSITYNILRFFVWIITARDCDHCKYNELMLYELGVCNVCRIGNRESEEVCKKSITRKYFKRKVAE